MKDIKDYLHLYLGCEVSVTNLDGRYTRLITHEFFSTFYNEDDGAFYNDPKPILRPLSDITDDEIDDVWNLEEPEHVLVMAYEKNNVVRKVALCSERTRYLLSRGFDLFGLIEAGLAIDKTTLKQANL